MNYGCRNRRYACTITLAQKFEDNTCMIEKTVWQDEKDFTLDVSVNLQDDWVYGKEKNLMFQMRTCLRPRIRLQAVEEKQGYCIEMIFGRLNNS